MASDDSEPVSDAEAAALFADIEDASALVLAVSGGPDSTALMLLAARWRATLAQRPTLIAVTVDHGLRPESKQEAAAVAKLARKLEIAHRTLRWTGKKPATGLPQAARFARYRLLADAARKAKASHILTAHTLDDQAETVLIRMGRGSGITGLGAMSRCAPLPTAQPTPSPLAGGGWGGGYATRTASARTPPSRRASRVDLPRKGGGETEFAARASHIALVRPLLGLPKSRLIATLRAANIPFVQDPSNRDPRFTRARLRGLMPQLAAEGLDAGRLGTLAARLRRADEALEVAVDAAAAALHLSHRERSDREAIRVRGYKAEGQEPPHPSPLPSRSRIYPTSTKLDSRTRASPSSGREREPALPRGEAVTIDADGFAALPDEIALRLLGRAIAAAGDEGPVELGKLEALKAALDTARASGARFRRSLAGAVVTLAKDRLTVERAPPRRGRMAAKSGRRPLTTHRKAPPKRAKSG